MNTKKLTSLPMANRFVPHQSGTNTSIQSRGEVKSSPHTARIFTRLLVCLVTIYACLISHTVLGLDYYFRGSISLERVEDTVFADTYCPSGTPAALYGCGTGSDDLKYSSKGGFDQFQSVEIGLGVSTLDNMRFEILLEYLPSMEFKGDTNFLPLDLQQSVNAELTSISSSIVGYLDFPRLGGLSTRNFVPYVGVGFGLAKNRIETTTMTFPVTTTIVPGDSRTSLMWIASLGATMQLSERAKLDLGLRYTDWGKVRTGQGEGTVNWRDGARDPLSLNLGRTEAELRGYGLRVSLLYSL